MIRPPHLPALLLATILVLLGGCGSVIGNERARAGGESDPAFVTVATPPGQTLHPVIVTTVFNAQPADQDRGATDGNENNGPSMSAAPVPEPGYVALNGVALEELLVMPPEVRQRVRDIIRDGRQLNRNPRAFSKLGASVVDTRHFMGRFDYGPYVLGEYENLQQAIDHFSGSFERDSVATRRGLSARTAFDPIWADKELCLPNESVIDCELRLHNPSILLIALGTNDIDTAANFEEQFRAVIQYAIDSAVVPVVATKADRFEGPDNRNNDIMRRLASEFAVPLWDFDLLADTLPERGISGDEVHLTLFDQYDYTSPTAFERGYGMYNLSALMMLEAIRQEMLIVDIEDAT